MPRGTGCAGAALARDGLMPRSTGCARAALAMNLTINFPGSELPGLSIRFSNDVILGIEFSAPETADAKRIPSVDKNAFAKKITAEFHQYFLSPEHIFSLPCKLEQGTVFQQKVWQALIQIPAGQVKTYGQLARELHSSPRAVGNACRKNPCPVIVPCHRVVSASGIGGYAGDTLMTQKGTINFLQIKQWLLAHEQAKIG